MTTMKITIPNHLVRAAGGEGQRYAMHVVAAYPSGVAFATDGRMLAITLCEVEAGDGAAPSIIPADLFPEKPPWGFSDFQLVGGEWRNTSRGWYGQPEDGAIPPIADVIPEFYAADESVYVHLDARRMFRLAEALGDDQVSLCIHKDGKKPILVQPLEGPDSIGVLMTISKADERRDESANRWSGVRAKALAGVAEPAKETP